MRIGTWFWAGEGVSVEPKGAGPKQVGGPPPSPYPPINKVSAPSQGAGTGQEALTEENQGCCLLHVSPHTGPGHRSVPTGPLWWWYSDGVRRATCSHWKVWDGEPVSPVANHGPRLPRAGSDGACIGDTVRVPGRGPAWATARCAAPCHQVAPGRTLR